MKKLFVTALATTMLVACSQDETLEVPSNSGRIEFKGAFVETATRAAVDPSTTTGSLTAFDVWAFMDDPSGTVLVDEDVTKVGDTWGYTNTQYWLPDHTYYFGALAPMNSDNWELSTANANTHGAGVVTFENKDGSEDLIYAATSVTTSPNINETPDKVALTFNHLLSKVKFTFKNGFATDNADIVVREIKMTAPQKGTIDLAVENWWDGDDWQLGEGSLDLAFGDVRRLNKGEADECAQERLTIPATGSQVYKIDFDVVLYMGGNEVDGGGVPTEFHKTSTVTNVTLEMGKAYNFTAEINPENLNLSEIEFKVVEVKEWVDAADKDDQVLETELNAAIQLGGEVTLTQDVVLSAPLVVTKNSVLNLNGHNITAPLFAESNGSINEGATDSYAFWVKEGGELTINGDGEVKTQSCDYSIAVWAQGGKVTINGGYYENAGEGSDLVYASAGGQVIINGGTFKANEKQAGVSGNNNLHSALNLKDDSNSSIVVYGGSFYKFNPQNNVSEGEGTNFCAEGYAAVKDGDWYVVGKPVASVEDLTNALSTAPSVNVTEAINNGSGVISVRNNDVVLNMYDKKVTAGGQGTNNYAFNLYGSSVEVNNANIDGAGFAVMQESNVTVNSGTIAAKPGKSGRNMFYVIGNSEVTVNEGNYTFDRTSCFFVYVAEGSTCYIKGGNYYKPLANDASKDMFVNGASTGKVYISGGTFNVDPTAWLADGYKAVKSNGIWTVVAE